MSVEIEGISIEYRTIQRKEYMHREEYIDILEKLWGGNLDLSKIWSWILFKHATPSINTELAEWKESGVRSLLLVYNIEMLDLLDEMGYDEAEAIREAYDFLQKKLHDSSFKQYFDIAIASEYGDANCDYLKRFLDLCSFSSVLDTNSSVPGIAIVKLPFSISSFDNKDAVSIAGVAVPRKGGIILGESEYLIHSHPFNPPLTMVYDRNLLVYTTSRNLDTPDDKNTRRRLGKRNDFPAKIPISGHLRLTIDNEQFELIKQARPLSKEPKTTPPTAQNKRDHSTPEQRSGSRYAIELERVHIEFDSLTSINLIAVRKNGKTFVFGGNDCNAEECIILFTFRIHEQNFTIHPIQKVTLHQEENRLKISPASPVTTAQISGTATDSAPATDAEELSHTDNQSATVMSGEQTFTFDEVSEIYLDDSRITLTPESIDLFYVHYPVLTFSTSAELGRKSEAFETTLSMLDIAHGARYVTEYESRLLGQLISSRQLALSVSGNRLAITNLSRNVDLYIVHQGQKKLLPKRSTQTLVYDLNDFIMDESRIVVGDDRVRFRLVSRA